jgi:hypothetical protein
MVKTGITLLVVLIFGLLGNNYLKLDAHNQLIYNYLVR